MKVILIVLALLAMAIAGLFWFGSKKPMAPDDYETAVQTGGSIEARYMQKGSSQVLFKEYPLLQGFKKFEIYYPESLVQTDKQFPVIVVCNGSGVTASKYPEVFRHLASWGFVVIGTEEEYAWHGFGAEMSVRFLEDIKDKPTLGDQEEPNPFYQKLDMNKVGIVGHSQGAVGVINAIDDQDHGIVYKAAVILSPTNLELANSLYWNYDGSKITVPSLCGTKEGVVIDADGLRTISNSFPEETFRIMALRKDTEHGQMLYSANGYVVAWFMWLLQDDQQASQAFLGSQPEILTNPLYQDQQVRPEKMEAE